MQRNWIKDNSNSLMNSLYVVALQNPQNGDIVWVPFKDYFDKLTQEIKVQNKRQYSLFSRSHSGASIGAWRVENGYVELFFREQKIEAEITLEKSSKRTIDYGDIEGLPRELLQKPMLLKPYLENAWARVALLSNGEYKLYLSPKLNGGLEWWQWGIASIGLIIGGGGLLIRTSAEGVVLASVRIAPSVIRAAGGALVALGMGAAVNAGREMEKKKYKIISGNKNHVDILKVNVDINERKNEVKASNLQVDQLTARNKELIKQNESKDQLIEKNNKIIETYKKSHAELQMLKAQQVMNNKPKNESSDSDDDLPSPIHQSTGMKL